MKIIFEQIYTGVEDEGSAYEDSFSSIVTARYFEGALLIKIPGRGLTITYKGKGYSREEALREAFQNFLDGQIHNLEASYRTDQPREPWGSKLVFVYDHLPDEWRGLIEQLLEAMAGREPNFKSLPV
jgi:hypothetical protein